MADFPKGAEALVDTVQGSPHFLKRKITEIHRNSRKCKILDFTEITEIHGNRGNGIGCFFSENYRNHGNYIQFFFGVFQANTQVREHFGAPGQILPLPLSVLRASNPAQDSLSHFTPLQSSVIFLLSLFFSCNVFF